MAGADELKAAAPTLPLLVVGAPRSDDGVITAAKNAPKVGTPAMGAPVQLPTSLLTQLVAWPRSNPRRALNLLVTVTFYAALVMDVALATVLYRADSRIWPVPIVLIAIQLLVVYLSLLRYAFSVHGAGVLSEGLGRVCALWRARRYDGGPVYSRSYFYCTFGFPVLPALLDVAMMLDIFGGLDFMLPPERVFYYL